VRRRHGWTAIVMAVLVGCATGASSNSSGDIPTRGDGSIARDIPTLPRSALPGYVIHVTGLDATTMSVDALDPSSLVALLGGAGFQGGIEQRFTARWKPLTEVEARVLRFGDDDGAHAYVTWLGTHGVDMLGSATEASDPPALPGAIAFSHGPCGSCTKDPVQYLAAWTHGRYALTLLVGGPRAGRGAATPLAEELDARIGTVG
jgi:hypothetical protein